MRNLSQSPAQLRNWLREQEQREVKSAERAYQEACEHVVRKS